MKRIRFIGAFPPPYGGVTVKNQWLWNRLHVIFPKMAGQKPRFIPFPIWKGIQFFSLFLPNRTFIIALSARGKTARLATRILYWFNRRSQSRSLYMMMGGTEAQSIAQDVKLIKQHMPYRRLFVETRSMQEALMQAGFKRVSVYPNCRERPAAEYPARPVGKRLRCVFFSLITREKGVPLVLYAAKSLPDVDFTLYGPLDKAYEQAFFTELQGLENVEYRGVFTGQGDQVYGQLNRYDLLLLPTTWPTEGVPGVLIEAKIAALPAIVSRHGYHGDIIEDKVSGIILKENTGKELACILAALRDRPEAIYRMKIAARESAEDYYLSKHIQAILSALQEM